MTRPNMILALVAAAGCSRSASGGDDPQPQPPEQTRFDKPAMVKFHMRAHLGDLREVERLLVRGKLEEGKARAFLLTKPADDPGMTRWSHEIEDVTEAARSLVASPGLDEALRREARVAAACAACHVRTQGLPVFAEPPAAPADDSTRKARMARHQWAVDRMWEGMVGASDHHWRLGLNVLATTPLPFSPMTDAPALAARLQTTAQGAIASQTTDSLEDRARIYGEMLVTCSACHVDQRAPASAAR